MLPLTVLRRFDCVLEASKPQVLKKYDQLKASGKDKDVDAVRDAVLNVVAKDKNGESRGFHNHSPLDFKMLKGDPDNVGRHLQTIFIVNKTDPRVGKVSKDKALKILTAGVPSFSVNYENRRQVFVESRNDVLFYEKIYQRLSNYLTPEISLSFISSGDSRTDKNGDPVANCGQVKDIVERLRNAGNNLFGA
jgi:HsdM N-terminal domain